MSKQILKAIRKRLLQLDGLTSSPKVLKNLSEHGIRTDSFLNILELYNNNFSLLEHGQEEVLLELLLEDLTYIINNISNVNWIVDKIHAIERYQKRFFGEISENKQMKKIEENSKFNYLDVIKIKNYFSIKDIELTNLKNKKEIYFVGGNGDGKTILLQAIVLGLKKEYSGQIIEYIRSQKEKDILIKDEFSEDYSSRKNIKNVFAYGINRNKTREKFDTYGYSGLFDTSDFKDTTFLKNPIDVLREDNELITQLVKKLNEHIFKDKFKIEKNNTQITLYDNDNLVVQFEEFSEGYKSSLIWICDLVSRLIENQKESNEKVIKLEKFKAIVLIDEVDLYLHPKWKYDFVYNLRKVFPNIQFIMITHSTATVLGASKDAIFYKVYKENGETKISQPMSNIKNLMANNLSTSPLFDMTTARARNSDENLKTDEDFIYTKIHEIIAEQMRGKKAIIEDEIVEAINKELEDYIKEQGL